MLSALLILDGQYEEAIQILDEALIEDPDSEDLKGALSVAYLGRSNDRSAQGDIDESIDDLREAVRLDPADEDIKRLLAQGLINRGVTYVQDDRLEEAAMDLRDAVALESSYTNYEGELAKPYYFGRAHIHLVLGDVDNAISDQSVVVELDSGDIANVELLSIYHAIRGQEYVHAENYAEALADAEIAITLSPGLHEGYFLRGIVYTRQRQFEKAVADFQKVLEIDPTDEDAKYLLELLRQVQD